MLRRFGAESDEVRENYSKLNGRGTEKPAYLGGLSAR
jgi:hypothetical protein